MPWIRIPPSQLPHLSLFGIDLIKDEGQFAWYRGERGRMRIEKASPQIWVEDLADAIQLGATAVLVTPDTEFKQKQMLDKPH